MRKGPATNVAGTTLALVARGANGGNQWYPRNPRMTLLKGEVANNERHSATVN